MSYEDNIADMNRKMRETTGRILKGEKPAGPPVMQSGQRRPWMGLSCAHGWQHLCFVGGGQADLCRHGTKRILL
jgi:hypothetical protein